MVRHGRGLHPAQKRTHHGVVAGPRLARGRSENLMRSASCTPSEEEEDGDLMEATESASTVAESTFSYEPSSPMSARFSSTAAFSPPAFSPPPNPRSAGYGVNVHSREMDLKEPASIWDGRSRSNLNDVAHGRGIRDNRDALTLMGLLNESQKNMSYPLRLSEVQQDGSSAIQSPTDTVASSSVDSIAPVAVKRLSEAGFRPIAKRPANYRSDAELQEDREQAAARTAAGKLKGRKGPYRNQEQRDKVKAVRHHGACLRCAIMRQACEVTEDGKPCTNCQVKRRKFNIPCTRVGPAGRWHYLFPDLVTSRHDPRNHKAFIGKQIPGTFRLPLTHAANIFVELDVAEDPSINESELDKNLFAEQGEGVDCTAHMLSDRTVPLVPVISTSFKDVAEWLAGQVADRTPELFLDLHNKVFPESKHQHWPRDILQLVCEFHHNVYQSRPIKRIFRTLIVRHLMSRPFYVPFSQLRAVNSKLSRQYQESEERIALKIEEEEVMVPKFVNRYFKSALMYLLREALKEDFARLEELLKLHEKSPGSEITDLDRDEALGYVAVLLMIVAIIQIKIFQVAQSRDSEASRNCPLGPQTQNLQRARIILEEIEHEVIDHILGLFSYKFVKSNRKGTLRPEHVYTSQQAQDFNLLGRFNQIKHEHREQLATFTDLRLNLEEANWTRFVINNPTRVLLRFAETLAPAKSRHWPH